MSRKEEKQRVDIYAKITDRIVADLEKGVRPWMRPWRVANTTGRITRPLRHNGEPYSGMNVILLWSEAVARGFASSMWMTFKQAAELGGHVRKGESGSLVVYASRFTKTESDGHGGEVEREEQVAETGSAMMCADLGIVPELEPRPDHVSYIASWLEVLSNDKRAIFSAAAHAQRAVSYLHNLQPQTAQVAEAA